VKITDEHSCGFISSRAGIVQEQQDGVIAVSKRRAPVRCLQQCVHLSSFEVANQILRGLLEGN
jgi:hypothetical protein